MLIKEYIKELFLEAAAHKRRGIDLGDKLSILAKYKDDPYVLVHFSDLNKLGVNPNVSFDTPVGIYGYVLSELYDDIINDKLDFATDRRYMHIFRIKSEAQKGVVFVNAECGTNDGEKWKDLLNKISISSEKNNEFKEIKSEIINLYSKLGEIIHYICKIMNDEIYYDFEVEYKESFNRLWNILKNTKLTNLYTEDRIEIDRRFNQLDKTIHNIKMNIIRVFQKTGKKELGDAIKQINSIYEDQLGDLIQDKFKKFELENGVSENELRNTWFKTPFGYFFNACRLISDGNALKWNAILRKNGITAIIDHGCGMIHKNEPTQGIVLQGNYIEQLDTIIDPYGKIKRREIEQKNEKIFTNFVGSLYKEQPIEVIIKMLSFCIKTKRLPRAISFLMRSPQNFHNFFVNKNLLHFILSKHLFSSDQLDEIIYLYIHKYHNQEFAESLRNVLLLMFNNGGIHKQHAVKRNMIGDRATLTNDNFPYYDEIIEKIKSHDNKEIVSDQ